MSQSRRVLVWASQTFVGPVLNHLSTFKTYMCTLYGLVDIPQLVLGRHIHFALFESIMANSLYPEPMFLSRSHDPTYQWQGEL